MTAYFSVKLSPKPHTFATLWKVGGMTTPYKIKVCVFCCYIYLSFSISSQIAEALQYKNNKSKNITTMLTAKHDG